MVAPNPPPFVVDSPGNWDRIFGLVHRLWGVSIDGTPYTREEKVVWAQLLDGLQVRAARDGYVATSRPLQ